MLVINATADIEDVIWCLKLVMDRRRTKKALQEAKYSLLRIMCVLLRIEMALS